jgi:2-dehydro-3-deoxygluconokinase
MAEVITFGELMLRLKSPGHDRLFQSPTLEATFGGGEANVAVSLALFGKRSAFVSAVPDNPVGEASVRELRKYGVNVDAIQRRKGARLGIYFLETGANQRPSQVVYDREGSAISGVGPGEFDWKTILQGASWFHITGITPALSRSAAEASIEAANVARSLGLEVSIDLNFRKKLWNYGKQAPEVMRDLVQHATVVIANEEDIQMCLGIEAQGVDVEGGQLSIQAYERLAREVKRAFPNIHAVAITMRVSRSADRNGWGAVLHGKTGFYQSRTFEIEDIIDRVGSGDSFAAGIIFGLLEYAQDPEKAINFAVAASCLKHAIPGDFNLSSKPEVEALAAGNASGRVQR